VSPRSRGSRAPVRRSRHAPGAETLAAAALAVHAVVHEGRSADVALEAAHARTDRAAVRAIALGTLRWYLRLAPAIEPLLNRPFAELSPRLAALLVTTAHQVEYSRGAPEAQVHLAVDASRIAGEGRASGVVNAVLRRFVAQRAELLARVDTDTAARHAHPRWLVDAISAAWGEHTDSILAANNQHPPMTLRLDPAQTGSAGFPALLACAGARRPGRGMESRRGGAGACGRGADAARLRRGRRLRAGRRRATRRVAAGRARRHARAGRLRGARRQDAAHRPAHAGSRRTDRRDDDPLRLQRVRENLDRAGRHALLLTADLRERPPSLAPASFDRVLVDAPCSATGVIRRHPDIKLLRRQGDIAAFASTQRKILATAFELLRPGGTLIYCTCSVLPEENEAVVSAFLAGEPRAAVAAGPKQRHDRRDCWSGTSVGSFCRVATQAPMASTMRACTEGVEGQECIRARRIVS
jgi:16S rRNA (cytosine967-C5)-methyltransferase